MQEVMPPCGAQSGCEELLGKEFPAMLPTNVNNCSQAALNTSHDLCMKNIWRNLKIYEMYLQLITEKSGRHLRLKHVNTDMKHLLHLIHSQFGLEEQQVIHDLKVTAENLEELMGTRWVLLASALCACAEGAPLLLSPHGRRAISDCLRAAEKLSTDAETHLQKYITEVLQCRDSDCEEQFFMELPEELPTQIDHCAIRRQRWSFDRCFGSIAHNLRIYETYLVSLRDRPATDTDILVTGIREMLNLISAAEVQCNTMRNYVAVDVSENLVVEPISPDVASKIYSSDWQTRQASFQILHMFQHMASVVARSLHVLNKKANPHPIVHPKPAQGARWRSVDDDIASRRRRVPRDAHGGWRSPLTKLIACLRTTPLHCAHREGGEAAAAA
ncbi:unnamed protein product [Lampetra planeri]